MVKESGGGSGTNTFFPFYPNTVESGLIQTVANVVTRMTIPSWAAQPGSLAN